MKGPIAWMARNGVAANLLMLFFLVAGLVSLPSIPTKVFPEFTIGAVQVQVEYRGASPEEIEQSIVQPIEEQIEAVEGIDEIVATAAPGLAIVTAQLKQGTDVSQKTDEIQAEVNRITNLPDRAERPLVSEVTARQRVVELAVHGDVPADTLKELAYRFEQDLAATEQISFVQVSGSRDYEVSIEVSKDVLRAYGLSLPQVAQAVGRNSLDLPGGDIETRDENLIVRIEGQNYRRADFADIVLVANATGAQVRLGDIATIRDGFRDSGLVTRYNGEPAVTVQVFRVGDEQVLAIADRVERFVEDVRPTLPPGVEIDLWENQADTLNSRLSLLLRSAAIGALLVIATLALFLDLRVAFWVSFGIVVAFVGTLAVMNVADLSINQLTLFGFILALGIVVDDAVVVGESIYAEREDGAEGVDAAVKGTGRVVQPVIFAVLTTMAAFSLLIFLPGTTGKFLSAVPIIVIIALTLSLIESLFVLPHHLSGLKADGERRNRLMRLHGKLRGWFDRQLGRFRDGPLDRAVGFAVDHYGIALAGAASLFLIVGALFAGGYIKFVFFPQIQGQYVTAQLEMPQGTPAPVTLAVADFIRERGVAEARRLEDEARKRDEAGDANPAPLLMATYTTIGRLPREGEGASEGVTPFIQPSVATIRFKLSDPDTRQIRTGAFEDALRDAVGAVPSARDISFSAALIDVGAPVSVELSAPDGADLERAVARVREELAGVSGVYDVRDDFERGQRELEVDILPQARSFGLSLEDLATQLRGALFGIEAERIQRGREEVRVYVRLPPEERDSIADLQDYRIRAPGAEAAIPFGGVAEVTYGAAPSTINRREGRRIITVSADVRAGVTTGGEVTRRLRDEILPKIRDEISGLETAFGGEQREQRDVLPALLRNLALALFAIYALLAVPLRSYTQPLVILAAVPLGLVGAVLGHLILGLDLTILSLFGIVGLSGVVVNDALLIVDDLNERRRAGCDTRDAIVAGTKRRFRPILLTSTTTFLGVLPLIAAQSVQARFLVPLAASLAFGILFATIIQMLVVPALAKLHADAGALRQRLLGRRRPDAAAAHAGGG